MTERQAGFARLVADGHSQAEAYRRTYGGKGGIAEAVAARLIQAKGTGRHPLAFRIDDGADIGFARLAVRRGTDG